MVKKSEDTAAENGLAGKFEILFGKSAPKTRSSSCGNDKGGTCRHSNYHFVGVNRKLAFSDGIATVLRSATRRFAAGVGKLTWCAFLGT
jgi:hypothetical protein